MPGGSISPPNDVTVGDTLTANEVAGIKAQTGLDATHPPALQNGPLKPVSDSTTAIQVQTSGGIPFVNFDTTNKRIAPIKNSADANGVVIVGQKSRGTSGSPVVVTTGDALLRLVGAGYDGSGYLEMGSISLHAAGTIGPSRVPTRLVFATATNASPSVITDRMIIDEAGNVAIGYSGGAVSGSRLGLYGTGSGDISFLELRHATNYGANLAVNTTVTGNLLIQTVRAGVPTTKLTIFRETAEVALAATGFLSIGVQKVVALNGSQIQIGTASDGGAIFSVAEIIEPSNVILTATKCMNTLINNLGQSAEATYTLPTASKGLYFQFIVSSTGNALHIKAGANDKIYLDGTALDDGDKVSLASPAVGNSCSVWSFQTGAGAYDWCVSTISGVWTDGGA